MMKCGSKSQFQKGPYVCIWPQEDLEKTTPLEQATTYPQEYTLDQVTAYPHENIPKQAAANPEESASEATTWDEDLSYLLSNMPDIVDDPDEELVQEFILESWV